MSDILATGQIVEVQPNSIYRVQMIDGSVVRAYLSGKMKMHKIRVLLGDWVEFIVDQQGPNNRIIRRL
jgi:translation initiation factor IF-1